MKILIPSPVVGLQTKKEDKPYRLMHYVVQQEVEEGVLLYNTLTCAMALVTHEEAKDVTAVEGLIENRFLVPVDHDDKKFCKILKFGAKTMQKRPKGIRRYGITTTTGCNARCAYCFEQGVKPVHMTMDMAEKVAQYIITHRGEHEEVQIDWYGGEPLYNFKVMDRISTRLKEHDVKFSSIMASNAYLFSDRMVEKACRLWNLNLVMVTLDGTEENYNRIKAYAHTNGVNPYQRVMENIKRLLDAKIPTVQIRINLDYHNLADMRELVKECGERFRGYDNFYISCTPLFEYFDSNYTEDRQKSEQRKAVYDEKTRLEKYIQSMGLKGHFSYYKLKQGITLFSCAADSEEAILITPDGHLGLCSHYVDSHFVGHIESEEWDMQVVNQIREYMEEMPDCDTCVNYPRCNRLKICEEIPKDCFKEWRDNIVASIRKQMLNKYQELMKENS